MWQSTLDTSFNRKTKNVWCQKTQAKNLQPFLEFTKLFFFLLCLARQLSPLPLHINVVFPLVWYTIWVITKRVGVKMERNITERSDYEKGRKRVKKRQTRSVWKSVRGAREAGVEKKIRRLWLSQIQSNIEEHSEAFWSINLADGTSAVKR